MCLDAAAGSDGGDYRPGSGLAGMVEGDPRKESAYWTLELPDGANRTNLVDGDVVRLRSRYRRRQKVETGYLLGEPDCENAGQRVFAFGVNHQPGAFWAIRRAPVAK
jgi:hypothetical protein